ncbi:hypothetical protein B0H66DRAFT_543079 [Apodospora peruviana]|uniref:Uncharacterized protein n=1 Tax=Apodospora peruviana TaxID=516989 RepID=A0AAE0IRY5_9PEZI|nr:hypothetical protein B0H66DRAFT_543079 [Apodospora peruviana]
MTITLVCVCWGVMYVVTIHSCSGWSRLLGNGLRSSRAVPKRPYLVLFSELVSNSLLTMRAFGLRRDLVFMWRG